MKNTIFEPLIARKGGVNKACKYIANKLNNKWTWKYLYHVYRGTANPSRKLRSGLNALKIKSPTRKRYRLKIEAESPEQFRSWQTLTMEQRRNALDEKVKG